MSMASRSRPQHQVGNVLSVLPDLRLFMHNITLRLIDQYLPSAAQLRIEGAYELGDEDMLPAEVDPWEDDATWDLVRADDGGWVDPDAAIREHLFHRLAQLEVVVHQSGSLSRSWRFVNWSMAAVRGHGKGWTNRRFNAGSDWARDEARGGQVRRHFPPSLRAL